MSSVKNKKLKCHASNVPKEVLQDKLNSMKEDQYDRRVDHFIKEIRALSLPKTIKATRWLLEEMSVEQGFSRHDGRDYFVHPIAVAQTALDFEIVGNLIRNGDSKTADIILATCLLHDIIEDVNHITTGTIRDEFGVDVMVNVDNVSKRDGEPFTDYIDRFSSTSISALVKILDRLNNVSTLSNSSLVHRKRQLEETRLVYLPLTKIFRRKYWEYGDFYFQTRLIMNSILAEVERANIAEEKYNELEKSLQDK